jgi:predicted ester cyclase
VTTATLTLPADPAAADLARRTIRLIEEGMGRANLAVIEELIAADSIEHQARNPNGIEGAKTVARTLHRWMSDFSLTVEDIAVDGDTVWTRNRGRGVNTGAVMGHAPTGRPVEVDVFDVVRYADGKVVEHWGVADQLGMMIAIGAVPGTPRPATD